MHLRYWALLLVASALAGCAKKEEKAVTELPPEATAQIESQLIPPPDVELGAPPQERLAGAVHPQMTELLLRFEQQFSRMPEDFYEFSGRMMDSVPAAPPGMKYAIDPVDKAVKLVRK
ncbi:MAG: hypothetical protein ACXW3Z_16825 [Limisphaerales bacterium]